jgi:hypothetical protein
MLTVVEDDDQPERVGLFGILNVGFLMTGLRIGFVYTRTHRFDAIYSVGDLAGNWFID